MICPHCDQSLLQRERTGRTCSKCNRQFALDPKTNSLRLSDVRIRRVVAKLTDGGRTRITVNQLWYALTRKETKRGSGRAGAVGCLAAGLPVTLLLLVGGGSAGAGVVVFLGFLLGAVTILVYVSSLRRRHRAVEEHPLSHFRSTSMSLWTSVYGSLPSGVVDERHFRHPEPPARPRAVLLCGDASIAVFLAANGIPGRFGIALVTRADQVAPGSVPVIVLHDADVKGSQLAQDIRAALPGRRVVDAGLPPRAVMNAPGAVPERGPQPSSGTLDRLRASGTLTDAELEWLAKGWTSPLGAVPPAKLLAAVIRVVERVTGAKDADVTKAEAVGFLTWPGEAAT
ncbi:hypothetical protein ACIQ7D_22475 [Streptomyces sp. NPDC096310]|uniref:hypothetical protein n=1 Tax=Streptomyces sp. NPDC096310 TaxID=3366082 RepID=UPI00381CB035